MATTDDVMLRVSRPLRDKLKQAADHEGRTMASVLEDAVERYRRQQLLQASAKAYQTACRDETLSDGLRDERYQWLSYGIRGA